MPETTSHQLVVFSLGSEEYALPIGAVHEIIRFSEPRSVASDVAVDPRRHRPARQDHPDLRPRRRAWAWRRREPGKIVIV